MTLYVEFDAYGYPTERALNAIETFKIQKLSDSKTLIDHCAELWNEYGTCDTVNGLYTFTTGGWSGNESILGAMTLNRMFWGLSWYSSTVGGKYEFKVKQP